MTERNLKERFIAWRPIGKKQFQVSFRYKKQVITCLTANADAMEWVKRQQEFESDPTNFYRLTNKYKSYKDALKALFDRCKVVNNL